MSIGLEVKKRSVIVVAFQGLFIGSEIRNQNGGFYMHTLLESINRRLISILTSCQITYVRPNKDRSFMCQHF